MAEYKVIPSVKPSNCQFRDNVESQFNGAGTRRMWQGLQTVTDHKEKTSHFDDTDILIPDKLNTFFTRFEDNTVPLKLPTTKDCGLSFSMADERHLSVLTLARVNTPPPQLLPQSMRRPAG